MFAHLLYVQERNRDVFLILYTCKPFKKCFYLLSLSYILQKFDKQILISTIAAKS